MEKKQVFRQAVLFPELYASLIEVLVSSYFSFILIQNTCVEETFIKMNDRDKIFFVIFNSFYFTFRTSIHCNGVPVSEFWLWEWLVMWDVIDTSLVIDLWMFFLSQIQQSLVVDFFFGSHIGIMIFFLFDSQ